MSSCKKDESVSFGSVEYYPSFLWVDSNMTPVTKTFDFDFSQDAKDNNSYAEFQFVDNEGKPISTNVMQVTIDGKEIANNTFRVNSDVSSINLIFTFSPNAEEGKYQGYLKLISHTLDRLDSQPLTSSQQVDAFQWTLNFDEGMNPLAKILMWIVIIILFLLAIWFAFLKPVLYPKFGSIQKTFIVPGMAPLVIRFKGARMVVLAASHPTKQSGWNRFWTGKILYKTHPSFVSPITMRPVRRNKVLLKADSSIYRVSPNPMPGIGTASFDNIRSNMHITIN